MLPSGICYQHNKPSSELQHLHFWHPALPTAIVPFQKNPRLLEMCPLLLEDISRAISNFQVRQKHSPETTNELITESGEPTADWGSALCWNRRIKVLGWRSQISRGPFYLLLEFCAPLEFFLHGFPHWWETNFECAKSQGFPASGTVVSWPALLFYHARYSPALSFSTEKTGIQGSTAPETLIWNSFNQTRLGI